MTPVDRAVRANFPYSPGMMKVAVVQMNRMTERAGLTRACAVGAQLFEQRSKLVANGRGQQSAHRGSCGSRFKLLHRRKPTVDLAKQRQDQIKKLLQQFEFCCVHSLISDIA